MSATENLKDLLNKVDEYEAEWQNATTERRTEIEELVAMINLELDILEKELDEEL
jgi:hypothetical protein